MPVLKVQVEDDTYERLVAEAVAQCRPVAWQAELALRRAVGLPSPIARGRARAGQPGPTQETSTGGRVAPACQARPSRPPPPDKKKGRAPRKSTPPFEPMRLDMDTATLPPETQPPEDPLATLLPHHRRMLLEESGIPPEVVRQRGYRSVADATDSTSWASPSGDSRPRACCCRAGGRTGRTGATCTVPTSPASTGPAGRRSTSCRWAGARS